MRYTLLATSLVTVTACSLLTSLDDLSGGSDGASDVVASDTLGDVAAKDSASEAEAAAPLCGAPGEGCCKAPLAPCDDGLACSANVCLVSDAWAVGTYQTLASGFVSEIVTAHYDGTTWTLQKPVNVDMGLSSYAPVDIYQHGDEVSVIANENDIGTMYRWNTVSWAVCKPGNACVGPTPSSTSLWAITTVLNNGTVDYWVAGTSLMDLCANGAGTCASKTTGITGTWGTGNFAGQTEKDLWYSVFDHVVHYDGTTWTATSVSDARTIADVATNDLWIGDQQLRHFDGSTWSNAYLVDGAKTPGYIYSISGAAPNDVLAVGNDGNNAGASFAAHWDGSAWKMTMLPAGIVDVQKVWAPSRVEAFVVGAQTPSAPTGAITRWNGKTWTTMTTPTVTYQGEQQPGGLTWISITGRARARRN